MKNYNVTIVCFCYNGDEQVLPYSLKSANIVFGDNLNIALIDDDNHPISDSILERLKKDITCNFVYERSTFERNKNLNGRSAVNGMVDYFIKYSKNRDGIIIKLDPDTMILKRDLFDNFAIDDNVNYISSHRPGCHFSGICYAIKTSILENARKMLDNFTIPDDKGPEDYIIGLAVSAASLPKLSGMIGVWHSGDKFADAIGWNYCCAVIPENVAGYYNMFKIVTYGNWFLYKGLDKHSRVEPMKAMLQHMQNIYI